MICSRLSRDTATPLLKFWVIFWSILLSPGVVLAQSGETQKLTIFTSDPRDVILEVYVNEEFRPVLSRSGNSVNVELTSRPAPGTDVACRVILEVVLASRDRRKQPTDLCAADFKVTLAGGGIGGAVASSGSSSTSTTSQAATSQSATSQAEAATAAASTPDQTEPASTLGTEPDQDTLAPIANEATINPTEQPSGQTLATDQALTASQGDQANASSQAGSLTTGPSQSAAIDPSQLSSPAEPANTSYTWNFSADLTSAALIHGIKESETFDFSAECQLQTGLITVSLPMRALADASQTTAMVSLAAGSFARQYRAATSTSPTTGQGLARMTLSSADPLWTAIIKESQVLVNSDLGTAFAISLKGSATPTRSFVAACGQGATLPPVSGEVAGGVNLACAELGAIRSRNTPQTTSIRFNNTGQEPIQIYWIDYNGVQQFYATLQPGERYDQPSYLGHPWLTTQIDGYCLGVHVADGSQREIVVGATSFATPAPGVAPSTAQGLTPGLNPGIDPGAPLAPAQPLTPQSAQRPIAPISPPEPVQSAFASQFSYGCDDGRSLQVTFDRRQNTASVADTLGSQIVLYPARTNSGFRFVNQAAELRGRGQRVFWNDGRSATVCFER